MTWLYARHPVADFEQWKPAFAAIAVPGRKRFFVFAVEGNRNDLLVMEEFDTREDARAWVDSDDHREAMARAGVSAPESLLLEELENTLCTRRIATERRPGHRSSRRESA